MRQITVTEEKRMTVPDRKEAMPYALMADGDIIAVVRADESVPEPVQEFQAGRVKCPNCKFEYDLPAKDNSPSFFSIQHP